MGGIEGGDRHIAAIDLEGGEIRDVLYTFATD